jgi:uncharacterized NAD-dependent epimerase/dehydratase family protein
MKLLQEMYHNTDTIFLAHGYVGEVLGKTVHGVLMHSKVFNTVALIDRDKAGQDTSKICPGVTKKVPIYSRIEEALKLNPKVAILIGDPSEENIHEIKQCICNGMDIVNSSFVFLNDFPELVELASKNRKLLIDLRNVKRKWEMPDGSILNIKAKVVYVTGTDCGLGKRTAAYELTQEAKKRGIKAAFAATGQTGQMIGCEGGIIFDAISTNFAASAVEQLIVEIDKKGYELIFLEGQGGLMHYACSSVLSLLHASNPHAIVMVHDPERIYHAAFGNSPIYKMCDLQREINLIENLYLPECNRYKVVAIPTRGDENIEKLKKQTSLPVADVRKQGGSAILLEAVLKHLSKEYNWNPKARSMTESARNVFNPY